MSSTLDYLLAGACAIAERAGRDIMAIYRDESRWQVQQKSDASPLTAADLAANRGIVAGLQALAPEIPVISEECEETPFAERVQWPRCWLVDPLDGTKEFIARTDEFSVNIALIENNEVILGVVYSPVTGIAHAARRGGGAFRLENGEKQKLRASAFPAGREAVFRIAASRRHRGKNDQAFYEIISCDMGPVELTLAGSAFKICAVAAGEADVYPRFGTTMEWDTAAGQIIVEEAGGALLDDKGRPLRYNQRQTMKNGNFLVTGREPEKWLAAWQASQAM